VGNFINTVVVIGTVVVFISFILATAMRKNKAVPGYLKNFYLLPLLHLLLSIRSILFMLDLYTNPKPYGMIIDKIICVTDLLFWMFFFGALFKNSLSIRYIKIVCLISGLLVTLYLVNNFKSHDYDLIGFTNIVKCAFCSMYFFSIFSGIPILNLKKEPRFWIISGLLFCATVSTPFFLSIGYFRHNSGLYTTGSVLAIANISIIIMHLFFIKGYLCIIQPRKLL
jgi:hypothetical protein